MFSFLLPTLTGHKQVKRSNVCTSYENFLFNFLKLLHHPYFCLKNAPFYFPMAKITKWKHSAVEFSRQLPLLVFALVLKWKTEIGIPIDWLKIKMISTRLSFVLANDRHVTQRALFSHQYIWWCNTAHFKRRHFETTHFDYSSVVAFLTSADSSSFILFVLKIFREIRRNKFLSKKMKNFFFQNFLKKCISEVTL